MEQDTDSVAKTAVSQSVPQILGSGIAGLEKIRFWAYPLAIGVVYALGFIVSNANLVKEGVIALDFVNPQYFVAGINFSLYLVAFYLFAGRAAIRGNTWFKEDLIQHYKNDGGKKWEVVVLVRSLVHVLFFCCLSSALFAWIAFEGGVPSVFYAFLILPFVVLYAFDLLNWDIKHPKTFSVLNILFEGGAVVIFFVAPAKLDLLAPIFGNFIGFLMLINVILDSFDRYKVTVDRVSFTAVYFLMMLIAAAAVYGATIYGKVRSQVGGAAPVMVTLGISTDSKEALGDALKAPTESITGKLIHQTQTYLYLSIADKTLRLRAEDVLVLVTKPHENIQNKEYSEWVNSVRKAFEAKPGQAPIVPSHQPAASSPIANTAGKGP